MFLVKLIITIKMDRIKKHRRETGDQGAHGITPGKTIVIPWVD